MDAIDIPEDQRPLLGCRSNQVPTGSYVGKYPTFELPRGKESIASMRFGHPGLGLPCLGWLLLATIGRGSYQRYELIEASGVLALIVFLISQNCR